MTSQCYSLANVTAHFGFNTRGLASILQTLIHWRDFNVKYVHMFISQNSIGFTAKDSENESMDLVMARVGMKQDQQCCHGFSDAGIEEYKMDIGEVVKK